MVPYSPEIVLVCRSMGRWEAIRSGMVAFIVLALY